MKIVRNSKYYSATSIAKLVGRDGGSHILRMATEVIDAEMVRVMRVEGVTVQHAVSLGLLGPKLVYAGFSEAAVYLALMRLHSERVIEIDVRLNTVRFARRRCRRSVEDADVD